MLLIRPTDELTRQKHTCQVRGKLLRTTANSVTCSCSHSFWFSLQCISGTKGSPMFLPTISPGQVHKQEALQSSTMTLLTEVSESSVAGLPTKGGKLVDGEMSLKPANPRIKSELIFRKHIICFLNEKHIKTF